MKKTYKIANLIVGKYFKDLSEEELTELNGWLSKSEENQKLFKELMDENNLQSSIKLYKKDVGKNWQTLNQKIKKKSKVHQLKVILRYAAILIIPISFIVFFSMRTGGVSDNKVAYEISPGTSKATLILSDGSAVNLNEQNLTNLEDDGTKISKSNKQLTYAQSNSSTEALAEKFNTVKVPRGGEYQLVLSDGTRVWLNSETSLRYPVQFVKGTREVELTGEAYFEVAKDVNKPFIVSFQDEKVEVLGTSFNIKCYADENTTQTTLVTGKVKYRNAENELLLLPEKQAEFSKEKNKVVLKDVNSGDYVAWVNGRFIFKNQRLDEILITLSRWYSVDVNYENSDVKDIRFTGKIKRYDKIEKILEILEATKKIKVDIEDKRLTIKRV